MTEKAVQPAPVAILQDYLIRPLQEFFRTEAIGGILLLISAGGAMIAANSTLAPAYHALWEIPIRVGVGGLAVDKTLHHWINEGLMALFFFLVGLELKRELLVGELASIRKAVLPMAAALGGMICPALLYTLLNAGGAGSSGWGIPMATDIAFALGALALLGGNVPAGLLVFLTALAIVDDFGAVLVIALFYAEEIAVKPLIVGAVILGVSFLCNNAGVRRPIVYVLLGVVLWLAFLESGIHATVVGVLLAMTIPTRTTLTESQFERRVQRLIDQFTASDDRRSPLERDEAQQAIIQRIEAACHQVEAPLQRIEHGLHPWVTYVIIPLFAFANAGVELSLDAIGDAARHPITLGVVIGLVLGKQLGIMALSWVAVRLGWAELPAETTWAYLYGVSWLAGIGFTMSLFIAGLAFADRQMVELAKLGILLASIISGVIGYGLLRRLTGPSATPSCVP